MKTAFNTTALLDKVTGFTLAVIAVATVTALIGAGQTATAHEVAAQPMDIFKMEEVVVTAPRIHTVKLDTIVITAKR
jgi:choline dehydrogenase-like flavoprotein